MDQTPSKVELDTVDYNDPTLNATLKDLDITYIVVNEHGPAGGNPLVMYFGTKQALTDLIKAHFDDGSGDDYLLTLIKPA